uniref:Hyprothetical protein n=2 Tax=Enterococcus TaxID=1350 RepID=K7TE84_ENTFL|nr:hyprothetical protein [Enterococcus faecalis]
MSVTLNTKNTKETDVINLLLNRVTDQHVLVYLNEPIEPTLNTQELNRQELKTSNERQEIPQTEIPIETVNKPSVIKEISKKNQAKQTNSRKESLSESITKKNVPRIHLFISILTLFIVLLIGISVIQQVQLQSVKKESESLKEQIERVKETDISQSKIDTFGRYFLTYYFSQEKNKENYQSNLRNYVSEKVDIADWEALGKTLKSVNYYGSEQTKKGYSVEYLLNVSVDNRSKMQKITFEVEPTKNGFLVTTQPKLTDFSFN